MANQYMKPIWKIEQMPERFGNLCIPYVDQKLKTLPKLSYNPNCHGKTLSGPKQKYWDQFQLFFSRYTTQ